MVISVLRNRTDEPSLLRVYERLRGLDEYAQSAQL